MSDGKSGGAGQTYNYYGTIACGICAGPVDALVAIILDGNLVWPPGGKPWPGVGQMCTAGTLYVFDAQIWICTTTHTASAANAPGSGQEGWTEYTFARGSNTYDDFSISTSEGTFYGTLRLYWGTDSQTVDYYLQAANNDGGVNGDSGHGDQHPDYKGLCYIVLIDFLFGQEVQSAPNIEMVVRKAPTQSIVTGSAAGITDGQANLAAVTADILTNPNCIGLDAAMVDATSFQAVANYLDTNQAAVGASVLIDTSETLRSVMDKITALVDGYVRFNPSTKLIEMGVYQHGVMPGDYATLTEHDLTVRPKFKITSWQGTYSRATVRYNSRQLNYQQTSVHADDARAWTILKSVREINLDRPFVTRDAQALIHGRETLRVIGHAQVTGEISVRREKARGIRAGNYVFLDVDLEPNGNSLYQFFRVTKVTRPMTGPFKLELLADNTLAPVPYNGPTAPNVPGNQVVPAITSFRVIEPPTVLSGTRGAVIVLAQRPNNIITGCQVYFDTDPGGTFSSLGTFPSFAAKAMLHTAVAATDGALDVDVDTTQIDAGLFTNSYSATDAANDTLLAFLVSIVPSGGDIGQIAEDANGYQLMEICSVGAITLASPGRYTLTVLRGRQNTSPQAFTTASTEVWLIPRAAVAGFNHALFDQIRANRLLSLTPARAQFRFAPYTFIAQRQLSDCASEPFRFPLKSASAPALSLNTPTSFALTYSNPAYPVTIPITGTWNDPDGNMVEVQILLRLATEATDRVVLADKFSPRTSRTFNVRAQIEKAGNYTIKLIARDATNLLTERDITAGVTGSGAKCAAPTLTLADGTPVLTYDTGTTDFTAVYFDTDHLTGTAYAAYESIILGGNGAPVIPYGALEFVCTTPSATIMFYADTYVDAAGGSHCPPTQNTANRVAYPAYKPFAIAGRTFLFVFFQASATGLTASNIQGAILAVGMTGP